MLTVVWHSTDANELATTDLCAPGVGRFSTMFSLRRFPPPALARVFRSGCVGIRFSESYEQRLNAEADKQIPGSGNDSVSHQKGLSIEIVITPGAYIY